MQLSTFLTALTIMLLYFPVVLELRRNISKQSSSSLLPSSRCVSTSCFISVSGVLVQAVSSHIFPVLAWVVAKGRSVSVIPSVCTCAWEPNPGMQQCQQFHVDLKSLFAVHHKKAQRAVMDSKTVSSLLNSLFSGQLPWQENSISFSFVLQFFCNMV